MNEPEVARYGLRTFKVTPGYLGSMAVGGSHWKNGMCTAQCLADDPYLRGYHASLSGPHEMPHKDCTCGIYASHSYDNLVGQYDGFTQMMLAVIAAEGITIIGTRGFRTQYARIVAWWAGHPAVRDICLRECPGAEEYTGINTMLAAYQLTRRAAGGWLGRNEMPGPSYWKKGE